MEDVGVQAYDLPHRRDTAGLITLDRNLQVPVQTRGLAVPSARPFWHLRCTYGSSAQDRIEPCRSMAQHVSQQSAMPPGRTAIEPSTIITADLRDRGGSRRLDRNRAPAGLRVRRDLAGRGHEGRDRADRGLRAEAAGALCIRPEAALAAARVLGGALEAWGGEGARRHPRDHQGEHRHLRHTGSPRNRRPRARPGRRGRTPGGAPA